MSINIGIPPIDTVHSNCSRFQLRDPFIFRHSPRPLLRFVPFQPAVILKDGGKLFSVLIILCAKILFQHPFIAGKGEFVRHNVTSDGLVTV